MVPRTQTGNGKVTGAKHPHWKLVKGTTTQQTSRSGPPRPDRTPDPVTPGSAPGTIPGRVPGPQGQTPRLKYHPLYLTHNTRKRRGCTSGRVYMGKVRDSTAR